jgi:hypothetical protein
MCGRAGHHGSGLRLAHDEYGSGEPVLLTPPAARHLADDRLVSDWLALFEAFSVRGVGPATQYEATIIPDRTHALRQVDRPSLAVASRSPRTR